MPILNAFSNIGARAEKNSQGFATVRSYTAGNGNKSSANNITTTVTAQAGDLIIVGCSWDAASATTPPTASVADTASTTYTSMGAVVNAGATNTLSQAYWGIVPSGFASGSITVTWSWAPTNVTAKAINAISFYNIKQALVTARTISTTTATSATLATGIANTGDLVLAMVGTENNNTSTGASDTTRGSWAAVAGGASTGGNANTNQALTFQYKIVTGQGTQTSSWASLGANSALQTFVIKAA